MRVSRAMRRAAPPRPAPMPAFALVERPVEGEVVGSGGVVLALLVLSVVAVAVTETGIGAATVDGEGLAFSLMYSASVGCEPYVVSCVTWDGVSGDR